MDHSTHLTLQTQIRKDSGLYEEEFLLQYEHFCALASLCRLDPAQTSPEFGKVVTFLSQLSHLYPGVGDLPGQLMELVKASGSLLPGDTRLAIVRALILLKHRSQIIDVTEMYNLLVGLFACHDKELRKVVYRFLISDIRSENRPTKNEKLNSGLQGFLVKLWAHGGGSDLTARQALRLMIDLYRKRVWNNTKTVNHIALACFCPQIKVMMLGLQFFLGSKSADREKATEVGEMKNVDKLRHSIKVGGSSRSLETRLKRAQARARRVESLAQEEGDDLYPLIYLHDPQGFAERLFQQLQKTREGYEVKLVLINVISRLVGFHKLILTPFYSFLLKYLRPSQANCTNLLVFASQASHEGVPAETTQEVVRTIIKHFVADYCADDVIVVGINAIREICARSIDGLDRTDLKYVVDFRRHKHKGVVMAARGVLALYRRQNPELLERKERGRRVETNAPSRADEFVELEQIEGDTGKKTQVQEEKRHAARGKRHSAKKSNKNLFMMRHKKQSGSGNPTRAEKRVAAKQYRGRVRS